MIQNKQQIINLLQSNSSKLSTFGINKIGLFGSFISGNTTKNSDVDLLVQFKKGQKNFRNFMAAAEYTQDLLGRPVDFVTPESLSPYIGPHIKREVEYVQIT